MAAQDQVEAMMASYIYYGQYTGTGPISLYIRTFTWSKRSHTAAFRPPDASGRFGLVIEAWRHGVTENHWTENHRPGTVIDIYRVPCLESQSETFYRQMEMKKGARYDFLGVLSFRLRIPLQSDARWFCSEAVAHSAAQAGIILLNMPHWKIYPGLLDAVPTAELFSTLTVP